MGKKLTVTATGDSLFIADFPQEYLSGEFKEISGYIKDCDVKLTNLETNLSDFEFYPNQYSGGTWLNTRKKYFPYLKGYGFDFYGNANNHCYDYGPDGLMSTIKTLDEEGVLHAGTGESLEAAGRPATFVRNGKKIAVFAVDCSFEKPSMAGEETVALKSRPGVNYLRHKTVYKIDESDVAALKAVAEKTRINAERELSIATGFKTPDPEGVFVLKDITFTTDKSAPETSCDPRDLERILSLVKKAKKENDYVFVLVHCHDDDNVSHANPPEYLKEFSHALIDCGVSAVFGGGCHELRGVEIYKGLPIFYSLGDFIYQGMRVEILPADFMESYGLDKNATAKEALYKRSRGGTVGLQTQVKNFLTVLPKLTFDGDEMTDIELVPVKLFFKTADDREGLPYIAKGEEAEVIFSKINELSSAFKTEFRLEKGKIVLK